jgi:hypothetical protein
MGVLIFSNFGRALVEFNHFRIKVFSVFELSRVAVGAFDVLSEAGSVVKSFVTIRNFADVFFSVFLL